MMGFQLQIHIEKPYFAVSVTDFGWRWYISLSSCSRNEERLHDIPVISPTFHSVSTKWYRKIISGLWHGAAYNFVIWGGLHGLFQVIGKFTKNG